MVSWASIDGPENYFQTIITWTKTYQLFFDLVTQISSQFYSQGAKGEGGGIKN